MSNEAFIDSMIYGGVLDTEPPYEVVVEHADAPDAASFIDELSEALVNARAWRLQTYGEDVDVSIQRIA